MRGEGKNHFHQTLAVKKLEDCFSRGTLPRLWPNSAAAQHLELGKEGWGCLCQRTCQGIHTWILCDWVVKTQLEIPVISLTSVDFTLACYLLLKQISLKFTEKTVQTFQWSNLTCCKIYSGSQRKVKDGRGGSTQKVAAQGKQKVQVTIQKGPRQVTGTMNTACWSSVTIWGEALSPCQG